MPGVDVPGGLPVGVPVVGAVVVGAVVVGAVVVGAVVGGALVGAPVGGTLIGGTLVGGAVVGTPVACVPVDDVLEERSVTLLAAPCSFSLTTGACAIAASLASWRFWATFGLVHTFWAWVAICS
jgi:hypothetical protein